MYQRLDIRVSISFSVYLIWRSHPRCQRYALIMNMQVYTVADSEVTRGVFIHRLASAWLAISWRVLSFYLFIRFITNDINSETCSARANPAGKTVSALRKKKNVRTICTEDASGAIKAEKQKNRDGPHNSIPWMLQRRLYFPPIRLASSLSYLLFFTRAVCRTTLPPHSFLGVRSIHFYQHWYHRVRNNEAWLTTYSA